MKSVDDYRKILGVDSRATSKELKKAYRGLVKKWHPDQFMHDSRLLENAKEKLQEVNEAYHALQGLKLDPKKHSSHSSVKPSRSRYADAAQSKTKAASVKKSNAATASFIDMHFAPWRKQVGLLRRMLTDTVKDPWIITVFIFMLVLAIAVDWYYNPN